MMALLGSLFGFNLKTVRFETLYILHEKPIGRARLRVALLRTHNSNSLSTYCSCSRGTPRNTAVAPVPVIRYPDMKTRDLSIQNCLHQSHYPGFSA